MAADSSTEDVDLLFSSRVSSEKHLQQQLQVLHRRMQVLQSLTRRRQRESLPPTHAHSTVASAAPLTTTAATLVDIEEEGEEERLDATAAVALAAAAVAAAAAAPAAGAASMPASASTAVVGGATRIGRRRRTPAPAEVPDVEPGVNLVSRRYGVVLHPLRLTFRRSRSTDQGLRLDELLTNPEAARVAVEQAAAAARALRGGNHGAALEKQLLACEERNLTRTVLDADIAPVMLLRQGRWPIPVGRLGFEPELFLSWAVLRAKVLDAIAFYAGATGATGLGSKSDITAIVTACVSHSAQRLMPRVFWLAVMSTLLPLQGSKDGNGTEEPREHELIAAVSDDGEPNGTSSTLRKQGTLSTAETDDGAAELLAAVEVQRNLLVQISLLLAPLQRFAPPLRRRRSLLLRQKRQREQQGQQQHEQSDDQSRHVVSDILSETASLASTIDQEEHDEARGPGTTPSSVLSFEGGEPMEEPMLAPEQRLRRQRLRDLVLLVVLPHVLSAACCDAVHFLMPGSRRRFTPKRRRRLWLWVVRMLAGAAVELDKSGCELSALSVMQLRQVIFPDDVQAEQAEEHRSEWDEHDSEEALERELASSPPAAGESPDVSAAREELLGLRRLARSRPPPPPRRNVAQGEESLTSEASVVFARQPKRFLWSNRSSSLASLRMEYMAAPTPPSHADNVRARISTVGPFSSVGGESTFRSRAHIAKQSLAAAESLRLDALDIADQWRDRS
jgi:hypothetical protein